MIIFIFGDLMRSRKKKQVLTQLGINVFGMVIHIARPKSTEFTNVFEYDQHFLPVIIRRQDDCCTAFVRSIDNDFCIFRSSLNTFMCSRDSMNDRVSGGDCRTERIQRPVKPDKIPLLYPNLTGC